MTSPANYHLTSSGKKTYKRNETGEVRPQGSPGVYTGIERSMDEDRADTRLSNREEYALWEPLLTGGRMKRRHKGCA